MYAFSPFERRVDVGMNSLTRSDAARGDESRGNRETTLLLITLAQVAQAVWFYFQWGNDFTWNLPPSPALVTVLVAMTQASALSIRIVPELPNLPIPLVVAFLTLIIYGLVRRGQQRERYGRLR